MITTTNNPLPTTTTNTNNFFKKLSSTDFFLLSVCHLTPNEVRIVKRLLSLGLTIREIQAGMKSPIFIKQVSKMLMLRSPRTIVNIRNLINNIEKNDLKPDPLPPKQNPLPNKEKKQDKSRPPRGNYVATLRRLSVLAALMKKKAGLPIDELEKLCFLQLRALRDALKLLESRGLIEKKKVGRKFIYLITLDGILFLIRTVQDWQCVKNKAYKQSHSQNCTVRKCDPYSPDQILKQIKLRIEVTECLLKLGWYHRSILAVLQKHKAQFVLDYARHVEKKKHVQNKGAYLYSILIKDVDDETRKAGVLKTIEKLDPDTIEQFHEQSQGLDILQLRQFANTLRKFCGKLARKIFPGEVEAIAMDIQKNSPK